MHLNIFLNERTANEHLLLQEYCHHNIEGYTIFGMLATLAGCLSLGAHPLGCLRREVTLESTRSNMTVMSFRLQHSTTPTVLMASFTSIMRYLECSLHCFSKGLLKYALPL